MKVLHYLLGLIFSISMILVLLVTSIEAVLYWSPGYFEKEYHKYQVTDEIDIEMDDLLHVTDVMMDYLKDKREDLQSGHQGGRNTANIFQSERTGPHGRREKFVYRRSKPPERLFTACSGQCRPAVFSER